MNKTRYEDKGKGKVLPRKGHEDSEGGERSSPRPGHLTPRKETRYQLYSRLVGRKDQSERVREISPTPGFDPRTSQPVESRRTD